MRNDEGARPPRTAELKDGLVPVNKDTKEALGAIRKNLNTLTERVEALEKQTIRDSLIPAATQKEQPPSKLKTFKFWKDVAEVLGIGFAVLFGGFTYLQWRDARRHFQVDERSWLQIRVRKDHAKRVDQPWLPLEIVNVGKTPAKNIRIIHNGDFVLRSKEPVIWYEPDRHTFKGILYQSEDPIIVDVPTNRTPTFEQTASFGAGLSYAVTFARAEWEDIFGETHWVQFCAYRVLTGGVSSSRRCIEYNDTDGK